ncbi:TSN13 protein, partial [Buphagus erythrorhynchus]|nr:TSN13 protein [Buphagus erythrorhynchus]
LCVFSSLQLVSLLLIGIAAWGIGFGLISSFKVVGVVIAVGVFLFFIALVGLIGAVKHHQVLLFFYMIILLLVFIVQFSVSCACLALNEEQQSELLEVGWTNTNSARSDIERNLNCCGFRVFYSNGTCAAVSSSSVRNHNIVTLCCGVETFCLIIFGFYFQILGVWLTYRYRNQKDPRANPSAFI